MIEWLRYVIHAEVDKFLAQGWEISDDLQGTSHGQWSVLMKWTGEGEPDGGRYGDDSRLPNRRYEGARHQRESGVLVPTDD